MPDCESVNARDQSRRSLLRAAGAGAAASVVAPLLRSRDPSMAASQEAIQDPQPSEPIIYFRFAEIVLVLEPDDPASFRSDDTLDIEVVQGLAEVLFEAGFPRLINPATGVPISPFSSDNLFSGPRGRRTLIPLQPIPNLGNFAGAIVGTIAAIPPIPTAGVLQTLNLLGWSADADELSQEQQASQIGAVGFAVNAINARAPFRLGSYTVVAASPNWLAMPFQGW